MEEFFGTVSLVGDPDDVSAKAEASQEALRIVAGSVDIGEWDLNGTKLDFRSDGLHLRDGDDELVFLAADQDEFKLALHRPRFRRRSRQPRRAPSRQKPSQRPSSPSMVAKIQDGWVRIPRRYRPFVIGAAVLLVIGVLWTWLLVALLALTAGVTLLAGVVTAVDPYMAVKLPERLSPALLLWSGLGGLVLLMVGALLL